MPGHPPDRSLAELEQLAEAGHLRQGLRQRIGGQQILQRCGGIATTTEGAIGYVGPEDVDATNNAKVARVNGLLPTVGNVVTALASVAPPATVADRADPTKWAPVLPNPASGYALVAYTNLIFGQCYKDVADGTNIRDFLTRHYGLTTNNDTEIEAKKLIPLNNAWKNAVRLQFASATSALGVNNTSVCNTQGRPL